MCGCRSCLLSGAIIKMIRLLGCAKQACRKHRMQSMRIIQFTDSRLGRCLGVVRKDEVENVTLRDATFTSTHAAFCKARKKGQRLENYLENLLANPAHSAPLKLADLLASGSVLAPVTEEPGSR